MAVLDAFGAAEGDPAPVMGDRRAPDGRNVLGKGTCEY